MECEPAQRAIGLEPRAARANRNPGPRPATVGRRTGCGRRHMIDPPLAAVLGRSDGRQLRISRAQSTSVRSATARSARCRRRLFLKGLRAACPSGVAAASPRCHGEWLSLFGHCPRQAADACCYICRGNCRVATSFPGFQPNSGSTGERQRSRQSTGLVLRRSHTYPLAPLLYDK